MVAQRLEAVEYQAPKLLLWMFKHNRYRLYACETNLRTSTETLSVKMSSIVVMHDEVKACK